MSDGRAAADRPAGNTAPKITVVTPSYRSAGTLEATILSVLRQDYENLEYIVVDGAGDDSRAILERHDDRLAHWCSEPDEGQYDAIRKGFARATGDVLCWLNADDMLLPGALRIVAEVFAAFPEVMWMSSLAPGRLDATGLYSGQGEIPGFSREAFLDGYFLPGALPRGRWIQQESTFFRKALWDRSAHAFDGFGLAGDFALWCEFQRHAELHGMTYPLAGFRHVSGQRSEDRTTYLAEAREALERLRAEEGHARSLVSRLRISRLYGLAPLKRLAAARIGYRGRQIVRRRHRFPDAHWEIVDHAWLP